MKCSIINYKNYYIFPLLTCALRIAYGIALKVNLAYYIHYWRGIKNVGKTTLFRDLIEKLYNGDLSKGLLIDCGDEDGFKALDGLFYDATENWDEIEDIIYGLIENRNDNNFWIYFL